MDKILEFMRNNMGFSWKGFLVFLLPMLPNFLFFILPALSGAKAAAKSPFILDIIEHGSQAIFFMLLIFWLSKKASPMLSLYTILMAVFLLFYFGCWADYFTVGANFTMLMLMAIVPVIYFLLSSIWLHNTIAIIPLAIFGITHIIITYINYRGI